MAGVWFDNSRQLRGDGLEEEGTSVWSLINQAVMTSVRSVMLSTRWLISNIAIPWKLALQFTSLMPSRCPVSHKQLRWPTNQQFCSSFILWNVRNFDFSFTACSSTTSTSFSHLLNHSKTSVSRSSSPEQALRSALTQKLEFEMISSRKETFPARLQGRSRW